MWKDAQVYTINIFPHPLNVKQLNRVSMNTRKIDF